MLILHRLVPPPVQEGKNIVFKIKNKPSTSIFLCAFKKKNVTSFLTLGDIRNQMENVRNRPNQNKKNVELDFKFVASSYGMKKYLI